MSDRKPIDPRQMLAEDRERDIQHERRIAKRAGEIAGKTQDSIVQLRKAEWEKTKRKPRAAKK